MTDTNHATAALPPRRARAPIALRVQWPLVLATVLVLGVIVALRKAEPGYSDKLAPILVSGGKQQPLEGRNFRVTVAGFGVARAYTVPGDALSPNPRTVATRGVWLSVVGDIDALAATGVVGARIRTHDGLVYPASSADRPRLPTVNLDDRIVAPGLRESGAFFFELPPDRLAGAHVQFYWGSLTPGTMDSLVDVDLGLDAARAKAMVAAVPPVTDLTDMAP